MFGNKLSEEKKLYLSTQFYLHTDNIQNPVLIGENVKYMYLERDFAMILM